MLCWSELEAIPCSSLSGHTLCLKVWARLYQSTSASFKELCDQAMKTTDKYLALQKAERRGTLHKDDRSAQYPPDEIEPAELVRMLNEAWAETRRINSRDAGTKIKLWVLSSAVAAQAVVIGWLFPSFLDCVHAAQKLSAALK